MDCGPACIRMVAGFYGKDYPLSYLRTLSHLSREGVSVAGIRDALGKIGMESASFKMTINQLCTQCPLPAILHWDQNHFVVLYDVKRSRLSGKWLFKLANPAFGKQRLKEADFARHWLSSDKGVVVAIQPTDDFYKRRSIRQKHSFYRFFIKYVWPFKHQLLQLCIGLLGGILLSLITPFLTQALVDNGIGQHDMGIIFSLMLAQLFIFVGAFSMNIISSWITLFVGTKLNVHILSDYLQKLLKLPIHFFETKSTGDYNQRINDHSRLQNFVTQGTMDTAFSLLSALILLVIIGYYSVKLLAFYLFMTLLSALWMSYFWSKRKALDYENFKLRADNQNKLFEMMSGIIDIKINTYDKYKLGEWQQVQQQLYEMNRRVLKLGQVQSTGYALIGQLRNVLITFFIAAEVVRGNLTLGMMMSISTIIGQVSAPLSQLISFLQQFQEAKISLERSEEVHLCENEDSDKLVHLPADKYVDIHFSHVTFKYTGSIGKAAVEDISFDIPSGKTIAIVGESGSGKTTLMKLALKFYPPYSGAIYYGDHNLADCNAESLRKNVGIVMQDNFLFSDTILHNIVLGDDYDEAWLSQVLELACLKEYVDSLPLGVHTKVGQDGIGLSGGERQRLMIARAIYKRPMYLMLDEATSSLDAENEKQITNNISEQFRGKSVLIIAHRLSTVKNADNIIVLQHGRVAETGTHSQLVSRKGIYYNLVRNQLELPNE